MSLVLQWQQEGTHVPTCYPMRVHSTPGGPLPVCQQFWLCFWGVLTFNNQKFFFIFLRGQLFIEHYKIEILHQRFSQKTKPYVIFRPLRVFFLCSHFVLCRGRTSCWGRATSSVLQIRVSMLTLARAFANKPDQKGLTFTLTAVMRALTTLYMSGTSSLRRMRVGQMQVSSETEAVEGRVPSGRLPDALSTRNEGLTPETLPQPPWWD